MQSRIKNLFFYKLLNLFLGLVVLGFIVGVDPLWAAPPKSQSPSPANPAKPLKVSIKLQNLEGKKTSEKSGDELYLDITQYSSSGQSKTDRIPKAPLHWSSADLSQVSNLNVWSSELKDQEEMKVIFSLVEQDSPPWDIDDLIGSCQVVLTNRNGKLEIKWGLPVFEERVEVDMEKQANPQGFVMKGDNSEYHIAFSVDTTDASP